MIFFHCSDIHLGKTYVESPRASERASDFFAVLDRIVARAVDESADAVVVAGDLFHDAEVLPLDFARAVECLAPLERAKIPVVAVEGNHDWIHRRNRRSWMEALSELGYIVLLRPSQGDDGAYEFPPWDPATRSGGRIEIGGVTFFGLGYIGAFAGAHVPRIVEAAAAVGTTDNVLLFHVGVRTYCPNEVGCMAVDESLGLADAFRYVALGHGHKPYVVARDGVPFAFNPGSPECVNFGEERYEKGFNRVEWRAGEPPRVETVRTDPRPMLNLAASLGGAESVDEAAERLAAFVERSVEPPADERRPVVRIKLTGRVGFRPVELGRERVLAAFAAKLDPLHLEVENLLAAGRVGAVDAAEPTLAAVERAVVDELWRGQSSHRARADALVDLTFDVKRRLLDAKASGAEILEMIHARLGAWDDEGAPRTSAVGEGE
jgi:DNA repair exonuclease SbcCD nuclease subunit